MKKFLTLLLALALTATLAITGTVAYLTDKDKDVNVMTLGNVKIEQIEQEWNADETALQDFTQAKPLYPYVGTLGWENKTYEGGAFRRFTMNNVVDKYVSVENTGNTAAYVRTIIALEMGDFEYDDLGDIIGVSINAYNGSEFQFDGTWDWTDDYVATINGKAYNIMVAVHKDAVKPDKTTIPSLLQVYMKDTATNEDCEKIDGNGNGAYDILVLSQAVQTEGFEADVPNEKTAAEVALDAAFGDVTATKAAEWFGGDEFIVPVAVATAKELTDAMNADADVLLTADVTVNSTDAMNTYYGLSTDGNIDGNGKTITDNSEVQYAGLYAGGESVKNFTLNTDSLFGLYSNAKYNAIKVENVTINKTSNSSAFYTQNSPYGVTFDNVTMTAPGIGANAGAADGVVFATGANDKTTLVTINSGTYTATAANGHVVSSFYSTATVTINGGTFTGKLYVADDGNIVINGGTFNGGFNVLNGNIVINGGTFNVDPSTYVPAGKTVTDNGNGTWTVA